ncbi:hypothetical protein VAA049_1343 [Vibrio cholerae]|nr:hypothetical protein VAA049_1343 [Vibrio cholerae]
MEQLDFALTVIKVHLTCCLRGWPRSLQDDSLMAEVATYPVEYLYIAMFASLMFAMGFNSNV